jgi:hypothetical protein
MPTHDWGIHEENAPVLSEQTSSSRQQQLPRQQGSTGSTWHVSIMRRIERQGAGYTRQPHEFRFSAWNRIIYYVLQVPEYILANNQIKIKKVGASRFVRCDYKNATGTFFPHLQCETQSVAYERSEIRSSRASQLCRYTITTSSCRTKEPKGLFGSTH